MHRESVERHVECLGSGGLWLGRVLVLRGALMLTWGVEGAVGRDGGQWGPIRPLALCWGAEGGPKRPRRALLGSGGRWHGMDGAGGAKRPLRARLGSGGGMDGVVVAWGVQNNPLALCWGAEGPGWGTDGPGWG